MARLAHEVALPPLDFFADVRVLMARASSIPLFVIGVVAALELAREVDVLIHGGQFLTPEAATATAFGHATIDEARLLAIEAGARRLILSHHGPSRSDDAIDAIAAECAGAALDVTMATEGMEFVP